MNGDELFKALQSGPNGLSSQEAERRLKEFGPNAIVREKAQTSLGIFLGQFKSPLIIVLCVAGLLTFILREWSNTIVIFAAVLVNAILGFWQENKAENALELLKGYIRTRARVRRDGLEREIDATELVPGDVIRVSQGDRIPADARVLFANSFETDESALTGESAPVEKTSHTMEADASLMNRTSMIFGGTLAIRGFCDAVVTATGNDTEFGRIALLVAARREEPTPLQRAVASFAKITGIALAVLTAVLFGLGIYSGYGVLDMFLIAVAVTVSAVPEGLPVALTVILAVGVERLAAQKSVVRKLLAGETLGSVTLILTDKTGTLTQGRMELVRVLPWKKNDEESRRRLLATAMLNADVVVENPADPPTQWRLVGSPLEAALVRGGAREQVFFPKIQGLVEIVERRPFRSEEKFSLAVSHRESKHLISVVGAPEMLLRFTDLSQEQKEKLIAEIAKLARSGERLLGVISKEKIREPEIMPDTAAFSDFTFEGLLSFRDPLRPTVKDAISRIGQKGVKTIMVTGDHPGTAEAVARELGLVDSGKRVITGEELAAMNDEQLDAIGGDVAVYARVTPEQKVRLVKFYQRRDEVVAVTGDGINDAPALEAADIGVAVGSGTDVTQAAADMVILDNNFETLVIAIETGRKILQNIRKVIVYLLSDSLDEVLLIGGSLLVGIALPLNALQILFVNFFSDSFPAVAFAFEQGRYDRSLRPSRLHRNLLDPVTRFFILVIGVPTSALLFFIYYGLLQYDFPPDIVRTFIFASFASYTLFLAFSLRSFEKGVFHYNPFDNAYLTAGVGIGLVMTAAAIYVPVLQNMLGTVPLPFVWVLGVLAVCALNLIFIESGKAVIKKRMGTAVHKRPR